VRCGVRLVPVWIEAITVGQSSSETVSRTDQNASHFSVSALDINTALDLGLLRHHLSGSGGQATSAIKNLLLRWPFIDLNFLEARLTVHRVIQKGHTTFQAVSPFDWFDTSTVGTQHSHERKTYLILANKLAGQFE
jgi:hypothetical protein